MERFRKILFWCHLPVGVIAGLVILLMSGTGVLLTYERQITAWADTRAYRPLRAQGAPRLSIETLLARASEGQPANSISTITLRSDPSAPAAVGLAGGRTLFVDPYTGEVMGEGSRRARDFFRFITDWHRWLGAQGEGRATARAITGACNLGFLFLVASGFYLWWPRKWAWSQAKKVLWFKSGLPGKARDFNWHNVIGFWSAMPLFVVVMSAVVISYPWAGNLVYRLAGEAPPAPRPAQPPGEAGAAAQQVPLAGLDGLWARAEQQVSDWQIITLRLPGSADAPAIFTIDRGDGGQPHKRAQLTLDRSSGEIARWEPFSSYTPGRRARSLLRFAHTGEAAGIAGQTIAGLVSAGGAVLVWTGLSLSLRRFRAWQARARSREIVTSSSQMAEESVE